MLVLSRKVGETIVVGGRIRITLTSVHRRQVRLAIQAPPELPILREELRRECDPRPSGDGTTRPAAG